LVKPTGEWFLVDEQPDTGGDLVPNEATARKLDVDDAGAPRNPFAT
jgi:hypothetical protein